MLKIIDGDDGSQRVLNRATFNACCPEHPRPAGRSRDDHGCIDVRKDLDAVTSSRWRTMTVASLTTLVLAGAGAGVALAQTTTPAPPTPPSSSAPPSGHHHAEHTKQAKHAKHAKTSKAAKPAHGQFTKQTASGAQTQDYQRGTVTASAPGSITLRSPDGFTATYLVNPQTTVRKSKQPSQISQVTAGDQVGLVATKSGATLTALHLNDQGSAPASTAPRPTT